MRIEVSEGVMSLRIGNFNEPVWVDDECVFSVQTGKPIVIGSGQLILRNGRLIVERVEDPPQKIRRIEKFHAGLMNLGNTCFANATIQSLKCTDIDDSLIKLPDLDNEFSKDMVA